jgi:hypothetical protein
MNRTVKWLVTFVLLGCCVSTRAAQNAPEHERLKPMEWQIGDWVTEYEAASDSGPIKKGDHVKVCFSLRWSPERTFMTNHSYSEVNGKKVADSLEVISWDHEKSIVRHSYYGTWGRGQGIWTKVGDEAELEWTIHGQYGEFKGTSYAKRAGDTWTWQIRNQTHDGKAMPEMPVSTFRRSSSPPDGESAIPPEIVRELDFFVGSWTLQGEGARGPMTSSWNIRWAPGTHCLIVEYRRTEPDKVVFGNGLWGWDSGSGEIVYHAQYSDQGLEHIRIKRNTQGVLKGRYTGSLDGKQVSASCVLRKEGPNQWTFKTNGVAESGLEELDVRFTRLTAK